ncbi:MAG: hypothetical protein WCA07_02380 [Gloeobacterales cyanobacterium]
MRIEPDASVNITRKRIEEYLATAEDEELTTSLGAGLPETNGDTQ